MNVYDVITDRICASLNEGKIPWEKPWVCFSGERVGGWAHKTGNSYSLLNQMMLPSEGEYITYRQIRDEGGQLKKGAVGYPICFWKRVKTTTRNEKNIDEEKEIPVLRYYMVYRVEDCEGITPNFSADENIFEGRTAPQKSRAAEAVIKRYIEQSGVKFTKKASNSAFYSPIKDSVTVPLMSQFDKKAEYYSTVFHELVHSTGHRDRLNRLGTTETARRGERYSLEELVAEIGACASLYHLRIETKASIKNSNAYIQSWLQALRDDHRMIVKAAARAQKAVRYIFEGPEGLDPHGDWKPAVATPRDDGSHDTLPWDALG